jgi:hypothetical protein
MQIDPFPRTVGEKDRFGRHVRLVHPNGHVTHRLDEAIVAAIIGPRSQEELLVASNLHRPITLERDAQLGHRQQHNRRKTIHGRFP